MAHFSSKPCDEANCCCRAYRDGCDLYVANCTNIVSFLARRQPLGGGDETEYVILPDNLETGWTIPLTGEWELIGESGNSEILLWAESITSDKLTTCCSSEKTCSTFYLPGEPMHSVAQMRLTIVNADVGVTYILDEAVPGSPFGVGQYVYWELLSDNLIIELQQSTFFGSVSCKSAVRGYFRSGSNLYNIDLNHCVFDCITRPTTSRTVAGSILKNGFATLPTTYIITPVFP